METLQRTANRGSISTAGYDIDNSLKLEADNTEYLEKANDSGTNRKTFTVSMWFKRTELADDYMQLWQGGANGEATRLGFYGGTPKEAIWVDIGGGSGNTGTLYRSYSTQVLRDTSAWYHIVLAVDTTQATEASRFKLWLNGSEVTDWSQRQYPAQDFQCALEASINMRWGAYDSTYYKMCGYIAECHYLDGVAKVQTDFGEFDEDSGIWIPKKYTGSYGGNGCYLDFEDSSSLGADSSGNGNNFTLNNIAAADQATDTPTNNFCTLNPIVNFKYTTNGITEGATTFGDNTGGGVGGAFGTMAVTAGKWYWEMKLVQQSAHYPGVSAVDDGDNVLSSSDPQEENSTFRFNIGAARREYVSGGSQTYGSLDEFSDFHSAGDIIGIALNMDDNQISIYGNGTLQSGVANSSLADAANKMVVPFHGTINDTVQYNFGGYSAWTPSSAVNDENGYGTFEYSPPSGYYALCTKNLAEFGG